MVFLSLSPSCSLKLFLLQDENNKKRIQNRKYPKDKNQNEVAWRGWLGEINNISVTKWKKKNQFKFKFEFEQNSSSSSNSML